MTEVSSLQCFGLSNGLQLVVLGPGQLVLVHWAEVQLFLPKIYNICNKLFATNYFV